jgi:single-strand DNA-binding protein
MSIRLDENSFTLRGRLGADPEMKVTSSGKNVTTVSIATSWSRQTGTDTQGRPIYKDETDWHRVVAFNKDAELIHQNARKGDLFQCKGRISPRKYTDKDNVVRYTIDFVITDVEVMTWRERSNRQANQPQFQGQQYGGDTRGGDQGAQGEQGVTPPPPEFNPDDMPG